MESQTDSENFTSVVSINRNQELGCLLREGLAGFHRGVAEDAEKSQFVCREIPTNKNLAAPLERFFAEGQRVIENRHLPILYKEYFAQ
jgi:hypothetical protein